MVEPFISRSDAAWCNEKVTKYRRKSFLAKFERITEKQKLVQLH